MEAIAEAFGLGLLSVASPCLLPIYPGFIAYLAANSEAIRGRRASGLLGLIVLAGILVTMIAFGLVVSALAVAAGRFLVIIVPVTDLLMIVIGTLLVAGRNPFARLPGASVPNDANPYRLAFTYGLVLGPLALPCAGAFVIALFAIAIGLADLAARVLEVTAYGLGFGLPLVVLSLIAAARGQAVVRGIVRFYVPLTRASGVALVAIGLIHLTQSLPDVEVVLG